MAAVAGLLVQGCGGPPRVGEPIAPAALSELARSLNMDLGDFEGLRGSGKGELRTAERTLPFVFAFVYSPPAWLRVDIKPELGAVGTTFTALFLWDEDRARMYLPARMVDVSGSFRDLLSDLPWTDTAAVVLGIPDAEFLCRLEGPTIFRDGDVVLVSGDFRGRHATVEFGGSPPVMRRITLEAPEHQVSMSVSYSGGERGGATPLPDAVEVTLLRGGRNRTTLKLTYGSARRTEQIVRRDYDFEVPPGIRTIRWDELDFWRTR